MLRIDYGKGGEGCDFVRDAEDGRHLLRFHVHFEDLALVGADVGERRRILHHRSDDTLGNANIDDRTIKSRF